MTKKFTGVEGDLLTIKKSSVSDNLIISVRELDLDESRVESSAGVTFNAEDLPETGSDIALTMLGHIAPTAPTPRPIVYDHAERATEDATSTELLWLARYAVGKYRIAHRMEVQECEREAKRQERREKIARAIYSGLNNSKTWNDAQKRLAMSAADAVLALLAEEAK